MYNVAISILWTLTLTYSLITDILYNLQDSKYEMTVSPASQTSQNYTVVLRQCIGVPDIGQDPTLFGIIQAWYVPVLKSLHSKHKQELDTDR